MVRIGEKVMIFQADGSVVAMDVKSPTSNQRAIIIDDGEGGKVAVKCLNTYEKDEGLVFPTPCGGQAFLPSEPPDYFRGTPMQTGMACSASQGVPETGGWVCAPTCGFRKELGYCRISVGHAQNPFDGNWCTHQIGVNSWRANEHVRHRNQKYGCAKNSQYCDQFYKGWDSKLKKHIYCEYVTVTRDIVKDANGNIISGSLNGACPKPGNLVVLAETRVKGFACNYPKTVCPYFNNGNGTVMCTHGPSSPPPFQPGNKPASCKNHGALAFTGWNVPGDSASNEIRCVFSKATEGMAGSTVTSSQVPGDDDKIQCSFSVF